MSGLTKGIKKVFKKVVKVVKKIAKPILIGAAIYFTAGLALAAFAPTAAFAASLPGFAGGGILGTGIGAGATAGTGLFSKLAVTLGMGGGITSGALSAGTEAGTLALSLGANAVTPAAIAAGAPSVAAGGLGAGTATAGMSLSTKLMLASVGTQAVGAFLAPGLKEQYTEAKRWRGAFYGTYADGSTDAGAPAQSGAAPARPTSPAQAVGSPDQGAPQGGRELMASGGITAPQAPTPAPQAAGPAPQAPPVENAPIEPRQLMQSGVRYV